MGPIVSPVPLRASRIATARIVGALRPAPFVLTCEHASAKVPWPGRIPPPVATLLRTHRGWDRGAWALTLELGRRLDAIAIGGAWSRLWIDLNRRIDDATLILESVDGIPVPWNRRLGVQRIEARARRYHDPYHATIDRALRSRLLKGACPLVFSVHSFTPDYPGGDRRFDVGVLFDRHDRPARRLALALRAAGFRVRLNEPYSGREGLMYSAERHGSHYGVVGVELEVNQARFEDSRFVGRLAGTLVPPLNEVASWVVPRS